MIARVVNFALHQRFVIIALTVMLVALGIVAFFRLPIEAYPDVGDVKVEVITLWPGHAAEEVERLVTIPLENELNGIARVTFLRSDTLFGLSNIKALSAAGTDTYWARQQARERITQADLPADAKPALGPLSSVIGEVFRYTLESKTVPLVELKAIQNWVLEREFRKIPGVADVVSWGGGTKQYQVNVDPSRLRGYNLTLKQVFDAVAANNSNAGGSYVPQGQYALTVRGIGLFRGPRDIENVVVAAQKGTPVRVHDIGQVGIGHAIRLGVLGRDHDDDLVQGIVLMRKGENPGRVIDALKIALPEIQKLLPSGVELRPYYSRHVLVKRTVTTVLRNLMEGAVLVMVLRGPVLRADARTDLAARRRLAAAHPDGHPGPLDPRLPAPAVGAREPAAALDAPALQGGARLVPAPAAGAGALRRRRSGGRGLRLRDPRQGISAGAGRGRPVGSRAVPNRDLGRGRPPLYAGDPRAAAEISRGPRDRLAARRAGRRHRSRGTRQRRVLRGPEAARGESGPGQGT